MGVENEPKVEIDDISKLNALVQRKSLLAVKRQEETGEPLAPEVETVLKNKVNVYHHRYKWFTIILCLWGIYWLLHPPSLTFALVSIVLMYFYVDFYGALLHVVLDHPPFLAIPGLRDPCLEFQWHHSIPADIVSKSFIEVCGDLNFPSLCHFAWMAYWKGLADPSVNFLLAAKLGFAYMGQWAHRQAHTPASKRAPWVITAQEYGLLVDPKLHSSHHKTHDNSFPILSGHTNGLVTFLLDLVPSRNVWLVFFLAATLFDVLLFNKIYEIIGFV